MNLWIALEALGCILIETLHLEEELGLLRQRILDLLQNEYAIQIDEVALELLPLSHEFDDCFDYPLDFKQLLEEVPDVWVGLEDAYSEVELFKLVGQLSHLGDNDL